ncbi:hypothetical protein [uncultured Helicobacter sp.]|uniref:hypothetical protein n=1 Tax=uncultured Helicobacter sp. TaxID=175537 RepID=UPI0026117950|nr:hypothetical protein [uncultured Helicobacter sp.]
MQQEESKNKKLKDIVNLFSFAILCFGQVFAQPNEVYATFEVQALQRATLALSANGVVEEIFVEVGAQVKKEKLLALKVKDVKENVQIARANLEVVEGKVTDKIEGAISGIESLKKLPLQV